MRFAALFIISWIVCDVRGQEQAIISDTGEGADSIRESHIQRFPNHFFVYPFL